VVNVDWWSEPLATFVGGERLAHLRIYYDFNWFDVFGHTMSQFPHGQSLGRLVKRDCPKSLTPVLLLTKRDDDDVEEPWIETDDKKLVVVVPIHHYLAHSEPDPAASYYAMRYGPGLTAAKNAEFLAQQAAVIKAVVEKGLTLDDVKLWTTFEDGRFEQLWAWAGAEASQSPKASIEQVLEVLRKIDGLDGAIIDGLAVLLGEGDDQDAEARIKFLDALIRAALDDEETQGVFVRNHRDFLAEILRSAVDAPDIVALAHRREVLLKFETLLADDDFFETEKTRIGGSRERVWQVFLEENPWIIGSTLAPQFLHSFSKDRLEQTVVGSSIAGPGKRPDAVLRTAGAISAVVLAEIKHHRTALLATEYRSGCWRVSDEVAGGVAQCQGTVDEAQVALGKTIEIKDEDGYDAGQAFICRPRSLLVVGSLEEFTKDGNVHRSKFESFERFRRGLRDPEILTFDELFERARLTLALDTAIHAPVVELEDPEALAGHT
jgi:hypothetical protein